MSTLSKLASSKSAVARDRTVVKFVSDVHEHAFTKLAPDGKTKVPTGETGFAFRVLPQNASGSTSGVGLWIWMDDASALDAFLDSIRDVYAHAVQVRQAMTDAGEWAPRPKAQQAAPAAAQATPAAKPKSAAAALVKPAPAPAAEAAAALKQAKADGLDDLPF